MSLFPPHPGCVQVSSYSTNNGLTILGMGVPHGSLDSREVLCVPGIVRPEPSEVLTVVRAGRADAREKGAHAMEVRVRLLKRHDLGATAVHVDLTQPHRAGTVSLVAQSRRRPVRLPVDERREDPRVEAVLAGLLEDPAGVAVAFPVR